MKPQNYFFNVLILGLFVTSLGLASTGVYSLLKTNSFANVKACDEEPYTEAIVLWNETFGGYYTESAQSIIKCPEGYAVAGWTNSSGKGDLDILLLRIAPDGSYLWNKTFGDVGEDKGFQVINCQAGGFALASTYLNVTAPSDNQDFLVTRIAGDGTVLWNYSYSGPEQTPSYWIGDLGRSIVECPNGDLVCAGVTLTAIGNCDVWLFRLSSNGIGLWDRTFHNWDIDRCYTPHSLVQCSDNGFALACYTYNSTQSNMVWLIKTNAAGIHQWNKTYGDLIGYQRPEGLVECSDQGFAIIANTQSFGAGNSDAWIIRTDRFGVQLWNKTYGDTEEDGGGQIIEMADYGFTFVGGTHSYDIEQGDIWLVRTDVDGNVLWNHTMGDEYGNSVDHLTMKVIQHI
ncbi:MAG: hypothetical protein KGD59_06425 [Candidatus Heimdallarchaeota archaeon]|nr:hypothetical protein [Candidatus Heimdallarchaeota archaeon]